MITPSSAIQTPRQILLNGAPQQTPVDQPHITRHKRDTATPSEPDENTRAGGDSALAVLYAKALRQTTGVPSRDSEIMVENIPPHSTFGQWWAQLGRTMQSRDVVDWMRYIWVDPSTVKINPESGLIYYKVQHHITPTPVLQSRGQDDKRWSAVSDSVMEAGKIIATGYGFSTFQPPLSEDSNSAPLWLVKRFYRESEDSSPAVIQQRAAELEQNKAFVELPMEHFSGLHEMRSEEALDIQKTVLGNNNNKRNAAHRFKYLATHLESDAVQQKPILDHLKEYTVKVDPHSTYSKDHINAWGETSLTQYLEQNGWDIPTTQKEVENLAAALLNREPISPLHGNYGGALAWPIPLDRTSHHQLAAAIRYGNIGNINLSAFKTVLEYLMHGSVFEPSELRDPQRVIDRLIQSPKGQALGEAIQASFEAKSVKGSARDWLLAALSLDRYTPLPASNDYISGYSLKGPDSYGKSASTIVQGLVHSLTANGRVSSPEKASIQAHLLLSSRAPEFLVKDIPDRVTFGSHSWVSFVTSVGRLEAKAPGSTATMTYGQVMLQADIAPISAAERHVEYTAQEEALKDWGLANGMPTPSTDAAVMTVRSAFNAQISALKTASSYAQNNPIPLGKDMALDQLKKVLPDMDPVLFDKKCITLEPSVPAHPGPYSVLDLYLDGRAQTSTPTAEYDDFYKLLFTTGKKQPPSKYVSLSTDIDISDILQKLKHLPSIASLFDPAFATYVDRLEQSTTTHFKYLMSQLPIEDRKNLEYGKITILSETNFVSPNGRFLSTESAPEKNFLLVKTERSGKNPQTYKVELNTGKIITLHKNHYLNSIEAGPVYQLRGRRPNKEFKEVKPEGQYRGNPTEETVEKNSIPDTFNSKRSSYITDVLSKHADFSGIRKIAHGITTFDTEVPLYKKMSEFALNLIPLRSAIVNFQNGNTEEGLRDLAIDVFGFVLGAGVAIKGAKAAQAGASAFSKVLHGAKIVGRAVVGALNPVDGVVDLATGVFKLGQKGVSAATRGFRTLAHSADNYDVLLASKRFDASSIGTFKLNNEIVEAPAIFQNGKWHSYNPVTSQPYGPPLTDFLPSAKINKEDFGKWATATDTTKKVDETIVKNWKKSVSTHRSGPEKEAFEKGYFSGDPKSIKGFTQNIKVEEIMKLAGNQNLTAEQVGMLVKKYDDIAYELGRKGSARFIDNIEPRFGEVTPIPQVIYLSKTAQLSDGQCAALSRAMATATAEGKEQILIKNMFTAAAFPKDPASRNFIAKLSRIQTQAGGESAFHAGQSIRQLSVQDMVKELADSAVSKSIMIDSPEHAMAAGVKIDGPRKTFYFYDPNHARADFSTAKAMEEGLKKLTRDKKLIPQYKTHSTDPNKLEFKVFDHNDAWQQRNSVFNADVKSLYDAPITPSKIPNTSNA